MKYYANDKYESALSQGHIFGDPTLFTYIVPANVPTIVVLAVGTEFEALYKVSGKTLSSLTGVTYLRGYAGDHDSDTPITCLNNEEFINQYADYTGIAPKGEFNIATQYTFDDLVIYNGSAYVAKEVTIGNLPTDTDYWDLLVSKGDQGEQGVQGMQGIQGIKGDKGDKGDTGDQGIQGIQGIQGVQGVPGADGLGVPSGGTAGYVLRKKTNADNDTEWAKASSGDFLVTQVFS